MSIIESSFNTLQQIPSKNVNWFTNDAERIAKVVNVFECNKCDFIHRSYTVILEHYKSHYDDDKINDNAIEESEEDEDEDDEEDAEKCDEDEYEEEEILVCSLCYSQFINERDLKNHFIKFHGYVKNVIAVDTNLKVNNDDKFIDNENEDDENEDNKADNEEIPPLPFKEFKTYLKKSHVHKCPMKCCIFRFESKEKVESHIKCHLSTEVERVLDFKCLDCSKEVKHWRNCTLHMWKSHQIDIDMLKCPACTYRSVTAVKVWRHMKVHKNWKTKVLRTVKRSNVKERKDIEPQTRWYSQKTCEICTRKFANSKTLSKHVKAVHNRIKPFICNVCGRKSARKSTWIIHMRQHTGEKPLQCKTCSFKASDPSVLKKHELRHKKISQYSCKSCDYEAIQSSSLKMHMKSFHPDEYKRLCCDQCSYVSISLNYLEAHKKDHRQGLIVNEDSSDIVSNAPMKILAKTQRPDNKPTTNVEISSDCFLPLESTDSIAHDPSIDTGGVTIPAHSEDTQFPN